VALTIKQSPLLVCRFSNEVCLAYPLLEEDDREREGAVDIAELIGQVRRGGNMKAIYDPNLGLGWDEEGQ
jgi:hypothetical protein